MADKDKSYMRMALKLARKGEGTISCEPLAGAVAVKDGRLVGRGFAGAGRAQPAVISALDEAGAAASGSTIYTNVTPCLYGRVEEVTEACAISGGVSAANECLERLIESRPARVVVGATGDPEHPDLEGETRAGGSAYVLARLRQAGVEADTGVLEQECAELNEKYFKYSRTGRPFVTVKYAQTLDGRIATATGNSQWISGPASLRLAHRLRVEHDAIMVGIGTVLADDPRLTVRLVNGRDPLRVVVDSRLRIPATARVLADGAARHTLIAATRIADDTKARELEALGAEILVLPEAGRGVNIADLLEALGRRRIASVLIEGGAGIITSLLASRQIDRLVVAVAPKIIGRGIEAVGDLGILELTDAITFKSIKSRKLGPDVIFDGRIKYSGG